MNTSNLTTESIQGISRLQDAERDLRLVVDRGEASEQQKANLRWLEIFLNDLFERVGL
jgi:hypothetical protein